jgi:hypothetical protein
MMRRRGGRGIIGTMATTAVVAGTAGAVQHRQQERYQRTDAQQQAEMQAQMQAMQAQQINSAVGVVPTGTTDVMTQLQQLVSMKESGLLTPEQFEAAKAQLLGV